MPDVGFTKDRVERDSPNGLTSISAAEGSAMEKDIEEIDLMSVRVPKIHTGKKLQGEEKMKLNKLQSIVFALVALSALFMSSNALADSWDKATKLTFSAPVEVPGMALPAGTYWFTLLNNTSNRNIVQIWNADRTQLITTILAIPDYRLRPTGHTVINFAERPAGSPEAVQAWFYPGDNFGQEFVYPKARATQLAQQVSAPVLEMPNEQAAAPVENLPQAPVKAVKPTGEEIEIAEVIETEQPVALPTTASPLPLLGLLGLLSLGAGLALRGTEVKTTA
jgi:hypothetical protein